MKLYFQKLAQENQCFEVTGGNFCRVRFINRFSHFATYRKASFHYQATENII